MVHLRDSSEKKIPIPMAIFLIIILLLVTNHVINRNKKGIKKETAKKVDILESVTVANKTADSASIVVCLKQKMPLELNAGVEAMRLDTTIFDSRDIYGKPNNRYCHYFPLQNLNTSVYYFRPVSGKDFIAGISEFTVGSEVPVKTIAPLWGKVVDKKNQPIQDGIVIATFSGSNPLAALIKSGDWVLPLHYLNKIPLPDSPLTIKIIGEDSTATIVKARYKNIDELKKTLILGNTYDFTEASPSQTNTLVETQANKEVKTFDIIYPEENQIIPGLKPYLKGVALPENQVKLAIDLISVVPAKKIAVKPKKYEVTTDSKGLWTFVPKTELIPGQYILTMSTKNDRGGIETLKRSFIIPKSGEGILGEATPEATLSPTPQEESTPIPTEIIPPTLEPTIIMTATPVLPRSGMDLLPLSVLGAGFVLIGVSLILIL